MPRLKAQGVSQTFAPMSKFTFLMLSTPSGFRYASSDLSISFVDLTFSATRDWLGSQTEQVTTLNGHHVLPS